MTASRPPGFKIFTAAVQPAFQRTDLVVHRDPQRLKNLRRRMRLFSAARREPLDQFRQLPRRLKFPLRAVVNNRPGKPPRLAFVAKFPKNLRQFFRARAVHQIRRRQRLPVVHPHVQRAVLLETEPAFRRIQLRRTHAQIQQHAVATRRRNPSGHFRKIAAPDFKPSGKFFRQPPFCRFNRGAIAIAPRQPSSRRTRGQNARRVSSPTERPVGVTAARLRLQRVQHLRRHHWFVNEFWHCAFFRWLKCRRSSNSRSPKISQDFFAGGKAGTAALPPGAI